jgi:hypothetical protein
MEVKWVQCEMEDCFAQAPKKERQALLMRVALFNKDIKMGIRPKRSAQESKLLAFPIMSRPNINPERLAQVL